MDAPSAPIESGPPRPAVPRPVAGALAVALLALLGALVFGVYAEVADRRSEGFCRPDHGIVGAAWSEERTWWPLGERCRLELPGGAVRVREPGWALTALVGAWTAVVAVGSVAPARSARRRLAWVAAVPAVPVAALIAVTVQPRSLARLVALTAVSVGFGSVMGAVTAAVVWALVRGRLMPTILGSWSVWAVIVFAQGRDSIT